jgi:hypothetical protein
MKVRIDNVEYEGACAEIVDRLRFLHDENNEYPDTESYILQMKINFVRETGKVCVLPKGDTEKRARAILLRFASVGWLEVLRDD